MGGRRGSSSARRRAADKREAPVAEAGQQYARVTAMLGNGRVKAVFHDGSERLCRIRGSMRRREWVHVGETVLVALRADLAGEACDIVFRYQPHDLALLKKLGEPVVIAAGTEEERQLEDLVCFEAAGDPSAEPVAGSQLLPTTAAAQSDSDDNDDDWVTDI